MGGDTNTESRLLSGGHLGQVVNRTTFYHQSSVFFVNVLVPSSPGNQQNFSPKSWMQENSAIKTLNNEQELECPLLDDVFLLQVKVSSVPCVC